MYDCSFIVIVYFSSDSDYIISDFEFRKYEASVLPKANEFEHDSSDFM